ncbi:MAG: sporulation transcriptional regulator SpoIIID [Clostridia bacterium]|nr:sporulation transcriptional regulator SpoIIID [Clostridia bacterium]
MIYFSSNEERCEKFATYILENKTTVRQTAKKFGYSKSTVHKDITEKLYKINYNLYCQVEKLLQLNKSERHLRGGEATRLKYLIKNSKNT